MRDSVYIERERECVPEFLALDVALKNGADPPNGLKRLVPS